MICVQRTFCLHCSNVAAKMKCKQIHDYIVCYHCVCQCRHCNIICNCHWWPLPGGVKYTTRTSTSTNIFDFLHILQQIWTHFRHTVACVNTTRIVRRPRQISMLLRQLDFWIKIIIILFCAAPSLARSLALSLSTSLSPEFLWNKISFSFVEGVWYLIVM